MTRGNIPGLESLPRCLGQPAHARDGEGGGAEVVLEAGLRPRRGEPEPGIQGWALYIYIAHKIAQFAPLLALPENIIPQKIGQLAATLQSRKAPYRPAILTQIIF